MTTPTTVTIRGVTKRFGALQVLAGVDLTLEPATVTAVVGPNAAGKSTLIKCLLGLVRPDSGTLAINGLAVGADWSLRSGIGYMPQATSFPGNLTGSEILALLDNLRGPRTERDDDLLDAFHLGPELGKPIRTLSGGTRQKLSAVVAFRYQPGLLILDEPTAGLDPLASGILKDKILRAPEEGTTVLLTSHIMAEIEELARTIVYFVDGLPRFEGTLEDLWRKTGEQRLERAVARLMRARVMG